jgi:hypothetical protein
MADFPAFLTTLKTGVATLASGTFSEVKAAATQDAQAFIDGSRADPRALDRTSGGRRTHP